MSTTPTALNFTMKKLDGTSRDLRAFAGKVVLFVNVASKCGYTKQYEGLEALHKKYGAKGLVILGFPSNDFGAQEPGTAEEIQKFCSLTYGVSFEMFEKITVKGPKKHPLYAYLTSKEAVGDKAGEVKWNFQKYLMNQKGVIEVYGSDVEPANLEPRIRELVGS